MNIHGTKIEFTPFIGELFFHTLLGLTKVEHATGIHTKDRSDVTKRSIQSVN